MGLMRIFPALLITLAAATASAQTDDSGAARCRGPAGRRGEDRLWPRHQGHQAGNRQGPPGKGGPRHGRLHGLDDGREDVRQLGQTKGKPATFPRQPRHRRLQRRAAADGAWRNAPALDSRSVGLQGSGKSAKGDARLRGDAHRHAEPPAERRQGAACGREENRQRPFLQSAVEGHRRAASDRGEPGDRSLHRLDDRRQDVRQLRGARRADRRSR